MKCLRRKYDGVIYGWTEYNAGLEMMEEVDVDPETGLVTSLDDANIPQKPVDAKLVAAVNDDLGQLDGFYNT